MPKKCARCARPNRFVRPLEQPPGEPDRVDDRRRDPPARQPLDGAVEEAHVEARVVGDEDGVAGEREEAPHGEVGGRCAAHVALGDPGQGGDRRRQRHARVDERLERGAGLERVHPLGADLDDPRAGRRETRRLEVEDDERGVLEQQVAAPGGSASPTAAPRQASRASPETTSSSSARAIAVGADASAKSERAASLAGTGPRRASTSSTRRSAPSKESCIRRCYTNICSMSKSQRERAPQGPL